MRALAELRRATAPLHDRLEAELDLVRRVAEPSQRLRIVEGFLGLHAGAEAALEPWLSDAVGLQFTSRRRTTWLSADIAALGGEAEAVSPCPIDPPASQAEALGFFYVLEGSTLGGKTIKRAVEAEGGDMTGLSFLSPYGPDTGERWRAFLTVLGEADVDEAATEAIVAGGVRGFETALGWLCGAAAP